VSAWALSVPAKRVLAAGSSPARRRTAANGTAFSTAWVAAAGRPTTRAFSASEKDQLRSLVRVACVPRRREGAYLQGVRVHLGPSTTAF
jgi:hypothetical protein